jgi:hypothetical protein
MINLSSSKFEVGAMKQNSQAKAPLSLLAKICQSEIPNQNIKK